METSAPTLPSGGRSRRDVSNFYMYSYSSWTSSGTRVITTWRGCDGDEWINFKGGTRASRRGMKHRGRAIEAFNWERERREDEDSHAPTGGGTPGTNPRRRGRHGASRLERSATSRRATCGHRQYTITEYYHITSYQYVSRHSTDIELLKPLFNLPS